MKIGIESQRIFRASKHGMDVVALELIRQIQRLDIHNTYWLFAKKGPDRDCIAETPNFRTVILPGLSYADWEQFSLPAALKNLKPDFIHCTANTAPLKCPVPLLLTLHDIIYLEEANFQGSAYQNFGNLYRRIVVPALIKSAQKIITVSEYEKKVIIEKCPVDPARVEVVYNGVDKRFNAAYPADEIALFRRSYQLPDRFILLLGNTAPKKNTAGAVKAYVGYRDICADPLPFVITDYPKSAVLHQLKRMGRPELLPHFIFPGYVPTARMPLLYNCSSLFLFPSLRESFGLPVLEAMACGVPVVASDTSAIPEVCGDAAVLINPENPAEIAERMYQLLQDKQQQETLRAKGLNRIQHFSWEKSAVKLLNIYEHMGQANK